MRTEVGEVRAARDRAIVEITPRDKVRESGLVVVHENEGRGYNPFDDYEEAIVLSVGDEIVDVAEGDKVIIRAESGGAAGADIGEAMGRNKGEIVVVEQKEMVCKL